MLKEHFQRKLLWVKSLSVYSEAFELVTSKKKIVDNNVKGHASFSVKFHVQSAIGPEIVIVASLTH